MSDLRAGDIVEVKPLEEILGTLDSRGALEALPYMPEMIKYCGKKCRVYKPGGQNRRVHNGPEIQLQADVPHRSSRGASLRRGVP
jgi:hypothetical protein